MFSLFVFGICFSLFVIRYSFFAFRFSLFIFRFFFIPNRAEYRILTFKILYFDIRNRAKYCIVTILFLHSNLGRISYCDIQNPILTFKLGGLGAKSQNLSSVAPPRKKKLVTIFSQRHVWGLRNPCFTKFSVVNYL